MGWVERARLILDVDAKGGTNQLKALGNELRTTEGALNKTRVAGRSAFDFLKANSGAAMLGIGTAAVAMGTKVVSSFQDAALGAGKLRDSLGLTAEQASRFQEVAGDLGIGVGTLEKGMGRMLRAAQQTPAAFDEINAAIARNSDGSTNVQQTFLNVIEALNRIPDASKRAAAAQKIFGRGWQEMSELIQKGASGVKEALASVGEGQIFDDSEIKKAREFRDALDDLADVGESLSNSLGSTLVDNLIPTISVITTIAEKFGELKGLVESAPGGSTYMDLVLGGPVAAGKKGIDLLSGAWDNMTGKVHGSLAPGMVAEYKAGQMAAEEAVDATQRATDALIEQRDEVGRVNKAWTAALEQMAAASESNRLGEGFKEAADEMENTADVAEEAADRIRNAIRGATDAGFALRDAQRQQADEVARLNELLATGGGEGGMGALAAQMDEVVMATTAVADAHTHVVTEMNAANGVILSAEQQWNVFNESLLAQANTLQGPARDALVNYIAQVHQVPPEVITNVLASGATEAEMQMHLVRIAAEGLPPDTPVWVSAPGAVESAAALTGVADASKGVPATTSSNTSAPGANQATGELHGTRQAADEVNASDPQANTSAPGATGATGELHGTRQAADEVNASDPTVDVSVNDGATGVLQRIANFFLPDKSFTITQRFVTIGTPSGGSGFGIGGGHYLRQATGGEVPGQGRGDKVPILAEPGEYMIRRDAVKALGVNFLDRLNRIRAGARGQLQRFATGGRVRPAFLSWAERLMWERAVGGRSLASDRPNYMPGQARRPGQWVRQERNFWGDEYIPRPGFRPVFRNWAERVAWMRRNGIRRYATGGLIKGPVPFTRTKADPYGWASIAANMQYGVTDAGGSWADPHNWRGISMLLNDRRPGSPPQPASSNGGGGSSNGSGGSGGATYNISFNAPISGLGSPHELARIIEARLREAHMEAAAGSRH